jgi:Outer membrane protein Omp28/Secretion system C-terminal sorting domain
MKKGATLALGLLLVVTSAFGQAKRYVLAEHFTNTLCSSCASQNPSFFTTSKVETNPDLHHISYHWRTPYASCIYYQASPTRQDARAAYYSIPGSPRVVLNGGASVGMSYVTPAIIQAAATTSPLSVKVTENTGASRTAVVKVKWVGTPPAGTYVLHVAVVEKKTNYVAPNGEAVHYNVFRTFLTSEAGDNIPTNTSAEQTITFGYPATFGAETQLYTVAWVQNVATKEVLNSGTRFDPTTATEEVSVDSQVALSPNPTTGKTTLTFDKLTPQYLTVQNVAGQIFDNVKLTNSTSYELNLAHLAAGIYIVKIKSAEGVAVKRVVKN